MVTWEEGLAAFARTLGRCVRNVMLVMFVPMPSNETSSPRCALLDPGPNSLPTLARCWRNARSFPAYRRQTWRCVR
jgi:hypothetical protein